MFPTNPVRLSGLASMLLLQLALAVPASAGGLYASEFATSDMGAAGSGLLAGGSGAGAATMGNPATTTLADSHSLHLGLAPGFSTIHFDADDDPRNSGGNGGEQGGFIPLLSSAYVHKLSDRFRLGFGVFSISGASLDPEDSWAGRNEVTQIQLFTLTFFPNVGVRVTDWLSVGVGPAITYGALDWKLRVGPAVNEINVKLDDLDDWGVGAVVGVLLQPIEDVRLGIVYQSKTDLTLRGDSRTSGPLIGDSLDTAVDLDLPQAVRADIRWQAMDRLALSFGGAWEDWGSLNKTNVRVGSLADRVQLGFQDTYKLRAGIHYQLTDKTMIQTGVSFDSAAIPTQNRVASLPIDKQWRWGIGGTYDAGRGRTLGYAFQYTNLGKAKLDNANVKGDYDRNELFFFLVSINYSKLPWDGMGTF
jgi:long-chain fatty acid transport protein